MHEKKTQKKHIVCCSMCYIDVIKLEIPENKLSHTILQRFRVITHFQQISSYPLECVIKLLIHDIAAHM